MPQTIKIQINPQVLLWARKEAGYKEQDIADKLHIAPDRYIRWESTGREIPLGILKTIANYYKRQIAVFLLPAPPPELKKPKDFRNLAVSKGELSPDTLLAMRRAHKYLELAGELLGTQHLASQYNNWQKEIETFTKQEKKIHSNTITEWLRGKLKITIGEQQAFRGYDDAFRKWRDSIERELGIYIFQFSLPEKELDGFCYALKNPPYAIVINSNTARPRKIFTLFHELAHIFKHQSGICLPDIASEKQDIEYECNEFAGKFLIPDTSVFPIDNLKDLSEVARRFKVSREVYLRRNLERKFIKEKDFFGFLKNLKEQPPAPMKKEKKEIKIARTVLSKSTRGEKFYNLVLEAVYTNKIDYTTASDVLGLNFNHISKNE